MLFVARVPGVTPSYPASLTPSVSTPTYSPFGEPVTPDYRVISDVIPGPLTEVQSPRSPEAKELTKDSIRPSKAEYSIQGVVGEFDGSYARVTLFYAGRENDFLFDRGDIESSGASYPGALLQIVIGTDNGYKIVHSVQEEAVARSQAPPPDLSFLEEA